MNSGEINSLRARSVNGSFHTSQRHLPSSIRLSNTILHSMHEGFVCSWEEMKKLARTIHMQFLPPHAQDSRHDNKEAFTKEPSLPPETNDAFIKFVLEELGEERYIQIWDASDEADLRRDCLIHGDSHCFNMTVEAKPNPSRLEPVFGQNGSFYLCDWEMARPGPVGRDYGMFLCFPIVSSLFHWAQGHEDVAKHLTDTVLNTLWEAYADSLLQRSNGNSKNQGNEMVRVDDLARTFRDVLGWLGYFKMIFYSFSAHSQYYNMDGLSNATVDRIRQRVGILGIRLMEVGFLNQEGRKDDEELTADMLAVDPLRQRPHSTSLDDLRQWYQNLIEHFQKLLLMESRQEAPLEANKGCDKQELCADSTSPVLAVGHGGGRGDVVVRRRSSLLRKSGRRVSDASFIDEALLRQLSSPVDTDQFP